MPAPSSSRPYSQPSPSSTPAAPPERDERIEGLRLELNRLLDDLLIAGGARLAKVKADFDAVWKEFTSQVDRQRPL